MTFFNVIFSISFLSLFMLFGDGFGAILEPSIKILINIGLVGKSADMRLDRAGSIGLRVGPLQIAPKIPKKRVRNPARF